MKKPSDRIWFWLHNEMNADEKEHFRLTLETDADLRADLNLCEKTHQFLKDNLPRLTGTELDVDPSGELVQTLIAEWDQEHPEKTATTPRTSHGRILWFAAPVAAAAALIALLTMSLHPGPIHWQRTAYGTAPQLRGETASAGFYSRSDLKHFDNTLRKTIESARSTPSGVAEKWTLQIHLQEMAGGTLVVELSGHPHKPPATSKCWNKSFQHSAVLHAELQAFGTHIAKEISGSTD